jgi:hypothetical protein
MDQDKTRKTPLDILIVSLFSVSLLSPDFRYKLLLCHFIKINLIFIANRYYFARDRIYCVRFLIEAIFIGQIFIEVSYFLIIFKNPFNVSLSRISFNFIISSLIMFILPLTVFRLLWYEWLTYPQECLPPHKHYNIISDYC